MPWPPAAGPFSTACASTDSTPFGSGGPTVGGNAWRTTGDINDSWDRMSVIGFGQAGLSRYASPGHWNDPDMLEVGNGKMKPDEYRTHMSLWAILAAPLLAGNDLSKMTPDTLAILTNKDVIAIDQDALGKQGDRISATGPFEVVGEAAQGWRASGRAVQSRRGYREYGVAIGCPASSQRRDGARCLG